jgi:hypothetical protein
VTRAALYLLALAAATSAFGVVVACSSSSSTNAHDNVIDDTHPAPTSTAAGDSGPSGFPIMIDGGYYDVTPYANNKPDGYAPLETCKACDCTLNGTGAPPADAGDEAGPPPGPPGYCIGGLPGNIAPPASCAVTGTAIALGCNAVPAACAGLGPREACPCILEQKIDFGCYAVCAVQGSGVAVYCPNP